MRDIIISDRNAERITERINKIQGRATARLIDYDTITHALKDVEHKLLHVYGLRYKRTLDGLQVDIDIHAQDFPRSYKYRPESTQFAATYKGGKWRLTGVCRWYTRPSRQVTKMTLTDKQRADIIAALEG